MPGSNATPNHAQGMGTLIVNLQSLEFALRGFLYNCETGRTSQRGSSFFDNITEGQRLEVNAFTNYDTLAKRIEKYNSRIGPRDSGLPVDLAVAQIRDALAHGRIAGLSPSLDEPLGLVKYSKPSNGAVYVTNYHVLTKDWFDEKIRLVADSIQKVTRAIALFQRVS